MLAGCWGVIKAVGRVAVATATGNKEQLAKELHPVPGPPLEDIEFNPEQFARDFDFEVTPVDK